MVYPLLLERRTKKERNSGERIFIMENIWKAKKGRRGVLKVIVRLLKAINICRQEVPQSYF
jgi:hypothetical protein